MQVDQTEDQAQSEGCEGGEDEMSEPKEDEDGEGSDNELKIKRKGSIMSTLKEDADLPRTRTRLATGRVNTPGMKRKASMHQDKTRLRSGALVTTTAPLP